VDDCSSDGTSEAARTIPGLALTVVRGTPKPADWAGKVWALEQGLHHVRTRYTLMLDADIRLAPGVISKLLRIAQGRARDNTQRQLVSVMATLPMSSFWEKLLCPAFIYFFKLLYPFALANSRDRRFGSAAGGCILLEMKVLKAIGGLESIRGELIDDCALARRVKRAGFRTWTGQSRLVESRRRYAGLGEIWDMVARSAYTQLRCSPLILILTSLVMLALFWGPPLGLLAADPATRLAGMGAWTLMALTYLPTLIFYGLSPLWALSLPLVGGLYLGMTWTSALRYARGVRSQWKGREYGRM
jgi:hopene-associated glycosyltransferase HpnB